MQLKLAVLIKILIHKKRPLELAIIEQTWKKQWVFLAVVKMTLKKNTIKKFIDKNKNNKEKQTCLSIGIHNFIKIVLKNID